jgi:nucleoside-diphosphate-sugar epimerase
LEPRRDYIFLDDLVAAILAALDREHNGLEIMNLGSGTSHSVAELIAIVQSTAGTSWPVVSEKTPRIAEISDVYADISQARNLLHWMPRVSLADGIGRLFHLRQKPA